MINIITGKPGTGKTFFLTKKIFQSLNLGRDVFSNYYINTDLAFDLKILKKKCTVKYWHRVEDLMEIKKGIIVMDEAQIYMNSRKWKDLPEKLQYKLQQHRKQGLDIWGAVQNVKRLDTVMRELVNSVYVIKKMGYIFTLHEYDIEEIDKITKKSYSFKIFFYSKKIANCYDTLQEIQSS